MACEHGHGSLFPEDLDLVCEQAKNIICSETQSAGLKEPKILCPYIKNDTSFSKLELMKSFVCFVIGC